MYEQDTIGGQVYRLIKAQVTSCACRPGQRLNPGQLAVDADASETTVYNALRRLAAEGLVVGSRTEGFHAPPADEAHLRASYRWACALAILAVRNAAPLIGPEPEVTKFPTADGPALLHRTEAFFERLASLPEIDECEAAMAHANDRLRAVRCLEGHLFEDGEAELAGLVDMASDPERLIPLLIRHRDRRLLAVADLARLRARGPVAGPGQGRAI